MLRNSLCLNGEWEFMPLYGVKSCVELPEKLSFEKEKIRVPSSWRYTTLEGTPYYNAGFGIIDDFQPFNMFNYPKEWSGADTGVYRRHFDVPQEMLQGRVFLRFDGIMQRSGIYVNGQVAAEWNEAYLPLKTDITVFVNKDGLNNELLVVVSTFDEVVIESGQVKCLGLNGSWFGNICRGIWGDVYLEGVPGIYIKDAFIRTSVRNGSIGTKVQLVNATEQDTNVSIKASVFSGGEPLKHLGCKTLPVNANSLVEETFEALWADPELWSPDNPFLYDMQIVLLDDTLELDRKTIRFGFRELWTEEHKFILNGIRINLRGDSWHFQGAIQQTKEYALNWFGMCKENGLNSVRLHAEPYPEYYLEAADEIGMLIIDETAIYGSAKSMPAGHPIYLDNCKKHVQRLVIRDRNHPSVVIWSLQNEMRWVDGRDTYKLHIPEMMQIIRNLDGTRPIILEGDNRLLPKGQCDIESYHYNIDGTVEQWDRARPLIFGEHGGWWYICPQNSSMFNGMKAYMGFEESAEGMALRERLYVEDARRNEISGITSFNFAYYMMTSMPEEDVPMEWDSFDTPGCKPKFVRKHSMTINNGMLAAYPSFKPNRVMGILKECYRPVTVIPCEYNTSFYDCCNIERNFDIYNDTLQDHECRLEITVRSATGAIIFDKSFTFAQKAGYRKSINISFSPPAVTDKADLLMNAALYHDGNRVFSMHKGYKLYPSGIRHSKLDSRSKKIAYFGQGFGFAAIKALLPDCCRIGDIRQLKHEDFDIAILGSYLDSHINEIQEEIREFTVSGGTVVILEQFKFAPGGLKLVKQNFFSAHMSNPDHPVMKELTDGDLFFWNPYIREDHPGDIIKQSFVKPVKGDFQTILECSTGEFGDGGDLWTPLLDYACGRGHMILNQLELIGNLNNVPQACILLRNILDYALSLNPRVLQETAVLSMPGSSVCSFLDELGLNYEIMDGVTGLYKKKIMVVDPQLLKEDIAVELAGFAEAGGNVLILPSEADKAALLGQITGCRTVIRNMPVYHLRKTGFSGIVEGISPVDLFRFEKVTCSPRLVENAVICENTIEVDGVRRHILVSVTGTPWYDYYVRKQDSEFSKIAIMDINRKNKPEELPYLVEVGKGKGRIIISQLLTDSRYQKNIRIYERLLANLGSVIESDVLTGLWGDAEYSVDHFMTLPHEEYKDYEQAEAYYTDRDYSLNNLGEGLYGWMKKVEKDTADGFINLQGSAGRRYFLTSFADFIKDPTLPEKLPESLNCSIHMDFNCSFKVWINGKLLKEHSKRGNGVEKVAIDDVVLVKGINRFVIAAFEGSADIRLRPVFKQPGGSFVDCLRYRLTIDEVDPK